MEYAVLCALVLLCGGLFYARRRRVKAGKTAAAKRAGRDWPATYEEDERDITSRFGALPCDGRQCGRVRCSPVERLFCRDVLRPVVGKHHFCGQYEMRLAAEKYRIDFAVNTTDGRRIALELDGFRTHVREMDPEQFGRQLRRQNELVLAGWRSDRGGRGGSLPPDGAAGADAEQAPRVHAAAAVPFAGRQRPRQTRSSGQGR